MGFTEPGLFDDDLSAAPAALPRIDLDELRPVGFVRTPHYPTTCGPFGDGRFPTAVRTRRAAQRRAGRRGPPALPTFVAPRRAPSAIPSWRRAFRSRLLTPKHHQRFLNSGYSQLPRHGPLEGGPFVELDAADAAERGIVDGDCVEVHNDRATLRLTVRITERLRPGVVAIPFGWWRADHPTARPTR